MSLPAFIALTGLVKHPTLVQHPRTLTVMLVLADLADDAGYSWYSLDVIAARAGMGRSTAINHINTLEAAGLLVKVAREDAPADVQARLRGGNVIIRRVPVVGTVGAGLTVPVAGTVTVPMAGTVATVPMTGTLKRGSDFDCPDGRDGNCPDDRDTIQLGSGYSDLDTNLITEREGGAGGIGQPALAALDADPKPTPEADPAPEPKATSKKALHPRVEAAMAEVMPDLIAWHTQHNGRAPHGRTTSAWTKALATRLADNGVSEQAVAERVQDIRTVLAWWAKPGIWYSAPDVAGALKGAAKLDKLVTWAREDERRQANPRRRAAGPGPFRAPDHYVDFSGMRDPRTFQPTPQEVLDALGAGMGEE